MADHVECSLEVDSDYRVEVLFLHHCDEAVSCDSCAVDEDVDATEFLDDFSYCLLDRFKIRNVQTYFFYFDAQIFDLFDYLGNFLFRIHVDDYDVRSVRRQLNGSFSADAGSAACYDCCFTIKHYSLLLPVFPEEFPYRLRDTSSHHRIF